MDRAIKWSGQLDRTIENHHILPEDGQRLANGQVNLTKSLRTITYNLRMDRDLKWSGQLNRIIGNHYILPEDGYGLVKSIS